MVQKQPALMLYPLEKARHFSNRYLFIGRFLAKLVYSIKYDLQKAEIDIEAERYCQVAFISACIYGLMGIFLGLAFGAIITRKLSVNLLPFIVGFSVIAFLAALIFHLIYPKMASRQLASMVDQDLVFALRAMLIQLSSGISLFYAMRSISRASYGQVSTEFELVIRDVNSGMSETAALEKLAFRTKSDILKKTIWQIITTMKSGGSTVNALNSQVDSLIGQQMEEIKRYSAELNLWTLVYLIIAAALPSLGVTFLIIASSISGGGIGPEVIILIVVLSLTIEAAMIFFIRTKVPRVIK